MALVIRNATVATAMSRLVEAGLYADDIFIDGVTFVSDHYVTGAGEIQVVKYGGGTGVEPELPGGHFSHEAYKNDILLILLNNDFKRSVEAHGYYSATMPMNIEVSLTWDVLAKVRKGRQQSGLAALVAQGTVSEDTTAITVNNLKDIVIDHRTQLSNKHVKPDTVIVSTAVYGTMLKLAGKDYVPVYNDDVIRQGKIGRYLGFTWIEATLLDGVTSNYCYIGQDNAKKVVDTSDVDFIMYDHRSYTILDCLVAQRKIDTEDFVGSYVQADITSGFRVTNEDCVLVKKVAAQAAG